MFAGKVNLEHAIGFIERWGEPHEIARLRQVLFGEPPSSSTIEGLLAAQREDGGWAAFWAKDYSSLDATCFRLSKAQALGVGPEDEMSPGDLAGLLTVISLAGVSAGEALILQAARRLSGLQQEDGRWRSEDDSNRDVRTTLASLRALSLADQI